MTGKWSELLSPAEIDEIHNASMRLLADVGVQFPNDEAIGVFKQHGVKTDGQTVYLQEKQLMEALETVPAQFTIHGRDPDRNVSVGASSAGLRREPPAQRARLSSAEAAGASGSVERSERGGEPVFAPAYGAPFLVDYEVGKRAPTMDDYDNLARLAHALPNQDMSGHLMVEPGGVPAHSAHLHMLHANMVHSDKPFIGSAEGVTGARHTMEMASILFGEETVKEQPVTIALINSLSPLSYSGDMLQALMEYVRWRQPVVIAALAMAGSTGPITLAGMLVMQNAELLAGIALTQLASPGTPVVFGSTSTNVDMKSGALAIGGPELSQMIVAHAQLARHYGLPSRSGGALTDASYPDAQAGFESMHSLLTAVNSGVDFVLHAAGILSSYLAFSYEKFVLDDEMCGIVRRFRRGFAVTPETIAYDVIAQVGAGGNYLMEMHTVKRCRTEFWQPALCDRSGLEAWMAGGQQNAVARARQRWQKLLREHEDPPLDRTTVHQLQTFVEKHTS